jgi:hypothetical protein
MATIADVPDFTLRQTYYCRLHVGHSTLYGRPGREVESIPSRCSRTARPRRVNSGPRARVYPEVKNRESTCQTWTTALLRHQLAFLFAVCHGTVPSRSPHIFFSSLSQLIALDLSARPRQFPSALIVGPLVVTLYHSTVDASTK